MPASFVRNATKNEEMDLRNKVFGRGHWVYMKYPISIKFLFLHSRTLESFSYGDGIMNPSTPFKWLNILEL